jgi:hypothetical protein
MVSQALRLQRAYDEARPRLDAAGPERFAGEWRRFLTAVQGEL